MEFEKDFLQQTYKELLEMRMLEKKLVDLYAEGRIPGHIHSGMGQEATFIGVLATRKEGDYYKFPHRPASAVYPIGTPLDLFFGEILAKKTGNSGGRGGIIHVGRLCDGVLGMSGALASDAAVPVGAALTISMEGCDNIAYSFMGDGTSNRGPEAEAMALASTWKLPVLFVCENNGFAISTPVESASVTSNIFADKAYGYGMPAAVVDGTDVLAVYEAAEKLVEEIRKGGGPAVLECKSYRWRGHFEGDQCEYRDQSVAEKYKAEKDCLKILEKKLLREGIILPEQAEKMRTAFERTLNEAIETAEASPELSPDEIYEGLYAE